MCMNCGCGEPDTRHHPTDITREDLQRAADGAGLSLEKAASNVEDSIAKMTGRPSDREQATAGTGTDRF